MIHVIIPVFNRLDKTISCLNSLKKQTAIKNLSITVVNDLSTDGTEKYLLKNFPEVTILNGNGSLYWGGAINYGIRNVLSKKKLGDWVLILNNDVELSSKTISKLIIEAESYKRKALLIPLTLSSIDKKTVIKSGTIVRSWFFNRTHHVFAGLKIDKIKDRKTIKVDLLAGRCVLHPVEIFDKVGNYDAKNFIHYGCDDEFSMRVKKFGYETLLCPSSIIFLKENESFVLKKKINIKNFIHTFFSIKSSSNIINKFYFTIKAAPIYAKLTFFLVGILKSFYIFLNKEF